jgi:hypothetical protein
MIPGIEMQTHLGKFLIQEMSQYKFDFLAVFYIGHGFEKGPGFWLDKNV